MPSRVLEDSETKEEPSSRARKVNYAEAEALNDAEEDSEDVQNSSSESEDEDEEDESLIRRPSRKDQSSGTRKSSRSTKFNSSMTEPTNDMFKEVASRPTGKAPRRDSLKSPAKQHSRARKVFHSPEAHDSDESSVDSDTTDASREMAVDEEDEPMKIQRIIAAKTMKRKDWKKVCEKINTSEIDSGSRWFQPGQDDTDGEIFEERFLVKWANLSYLHCSWETQEDLIDQIENAKNYLSVFFRKSQNGYLFTQDERNDGDYFDPGYTQVDRILEINGDTYKSSLETEDALKPEDVGVILDKNDPNYEDGTGREFLVKWGNTPYSQSTYEFERDLILNDIDYKDELKNFLKRSEKPSGRELDSRLKTAKKEFRRLYTIFGEQSRISEKQHEKLTKEFQEELMDLEFKNGGSLRDYQAEGVAWIMANYVNDRSSILADEMGLGKTLQTVSSLNFVSTNLKGDAAFLVIAPLSTLPHWYREFKSWTDLNTIIYHGSAEDRKVIRELEMAYSEDRPADTTVGNFLRKCQKRGKKQSWMVDVVITTPEIMVASDAGELCAVEWDVLVVDEAHRLKNHNSKLAETLRNPKFKFQHRILLTGTPIQNDVKEFWTLLHFIDPHSFASSNKFLEKYGDMKDKETVDDLHDEIRPYILRRLKEDVEKSVPPKEETLIEVELTLEQKQYYRALYEKNVKFLHKNKKGLDGPSLNNLAMQLRKCCNHLFLLNGVEEEIRSKMPEGMNEGDVLAKASGKLVLLDKLLPRLKELGHRILVFSQFKIMLDILEDYLHARQYRFERIDGSITGMKRQQAIDRFQTESDGSNEAPFVMLLSTRAGGVGINLTAADTCIIFDSDWNPQNDLQAQARCHRIGQTKTVKVYRLLTRKTYELQMYHMSSLKMGLDQAVLKGFENNSSGEGSLSKEEVEKLLRHGAYDILNEEKAGQSEAESTEFAQQDIDSILQLHSRTVVHENTGSQSDAGGGTFAKARFRAAKTPTKGTIDAEDVDIEDPDFWKKMVGTPEKEEDERIVHGQRARTQQNYSEQARWKAIEQEALLGADESDDDKTDSEAEDDEEERTKWGGNSDTDWKKDDAEALQKNLQRFGYGSFPWDKIGDIGSKKKYPEGEMRRMASSIILFTLLEETKNEVSALKKREEKSTEKEQDVQKTEGGSLVALSTEKIDFDEDLVSKERFKALLASNRDVIQGALEDAKSFAKDSAAREQGIIDRALGKKVASSTSSEAMFAQSVWPSLKSRGWKASMVTDASGTSSTKYSHNDKEFSDVEAVLAHALIAHPELKEVVQTVAESFEASRIRSRDFLSEERDQHLQLSVENLTIELLESFLMKYAPLQLVVGRSKEGTTAFRFSKKCLTNATMFRELAKLLSISKKEGTVDLEQLTKHLPSSRVYVPHPAWNAQHDATLIEAVLKHGSLDYDSTYTSIVEDDSLKWGPPFVEDKLDPSKKFDNEQAISRRIERAVGTAHRAIKLLNEDKVLREANGFNTPPFLSSLCIYMIEVKAGTEESPPQHLWIVKEDEIADTIRKTNSPKGSVELPSKKDLARRVKAVVEKSDTHANTSNSPTNGTDSKENEHNYPLLDLKDPANLLLAQIFRAVIKSSSQSKEARAIMILARQETEARLRMETNVQAIAPFEEIIKQLDIVKRSISKYARPAKNIIRAMIGEKPVQPKKAGESLFLPEMNFVKLKTISNAKRDKPDKPASSKGSTATTGKSSTSTEEPLTKKAKTAETDPSQVSYSSVYNQTIGDKVLSSAERLGKLEASAALRLTGIECSLLKVLSYVGVPPLIDLSHKTGFGKLDWQDIAKRVEALSRDSVNAARANLVAKQKRLKAAQKDPSSGVDLIALEEKIEEGQRRLEQAESILGNAQEYADDAEVFSKKTVMMLAKMIHVASSSTNDSKNEVGSKVTEWCGQEVYKWANTLSLLDDSGKPHAYTAIDFLDDNEENLAIQVHASLTPDGCHAIISQMSTLSRARFFLQKYSNEDMQGRLELAAEQLGDNSASPSFRMPDWWRSEEFLSSCHHDLLLLKRLLSSGFDKVQIDERLYGVQMVSKTMSFKHYKLPVGVVQIRANHLTRQLHLIEESNPPIPKVPSKKAATGPKFPEKKGLHAFFSAAPSSSNGTKRNSDPEVIDVDTPEEKKPRPSE